MIIGLDYPPNEKYKEGWLKNKEYIQQIKGFKKITIIEHKENFGAAKNLRELVKYALSKYDAYIETEDDNIFAPCFLDFMNKGLEKYKDDKNILAVSGYMQPINFENNTKGNKVMRLLSYPAWGIGVWERSRTEINRKMQDHYMKYVCSHRKILYKMRKNLRSLYQLILWTKSKPELDRKCDFTIECYQIINKKYTIVPTKSLVRNMGYDGTGENCGRLKEDIFSSQKIADDKTFEIIDNLNEKENKKLLNIWEKWRCNNPTFLFSDKIKKEYYDIIEYT